MTTPSLRTRSLEFALVVAALVVALALAESYVRAFHSYVRDNVVPGRLFEIDERLGWTLRPGASGLHESRYFRADYRINAFGFRDRARLAAKPAGTRLHPALWRLAGVRLGHSGRAALLEPRRSAGAAGVEIWNLAVPGYGLDQEILAYELDGQRFEADEVVLLVSTETLSRLPYDYIYRKHKPKFVLDAEGRLELVPIRRGVSAGTGRPLRHAQRLLPALLRRVPARSRTPVVRGGCGGSRATIARLNVGVLEQANIDRALAIARSRGQRLTLLVDFPPALDQATLRLRQFCAERGIRVIELRFPVPREQLHFGERDSHWKPMVHQVIADRLLDELRR